MNNIKSQLFRYTPVFLGVIFVFWWIIIQVFDLEGHKDYFTDLYWIIPMSGSVVGFTLALKWGWTKSLVGKSLLFFSLALLAEGLGLVVYSFYFRVLNVELAYPSFGDSVTVFGVVANCLASWYLLRVIAPIKKQLIKPLWHIIATLIFMSGLLFLVWQGFLYEGINDDRGNMTVLFNVLYPTTQLIYIGLCFISLLKVKNALGGRMFYPILFLLLSVCLLYSADYIFLKQSYEESWVAAGMSDLLYVIAYSGIVYSLLKIDGVRSRLVGGNK